MLFEVCLSQVREVCHRIFSGSVQGTLQLMPSDKTFLFVCFSGQSWSLLTSRLSSQGSIDRDSHILNKEVSLFLIQILKQKEEWFTYVVHIKGGNRHVLKYCTNYFSLVVLHMFALQSEQYKSSPVVNFTPVKSPGYKPRQCGQVDKVSGLSCQWIHMLWELEKMGRAQGIQLFSVFSRFSLLLPFLPARNKTPAALCL